MADGKIYITISDTRMGENGGVGTPEQPKEKEKEKHKSVGEYAKHQFFSLVKGQAQQIANYSIGNIGNFTGDFHAQRTAQMGMKFINVIKDSTMSFVGGATLTGTMTGGVVALAVVGMSMAISSGMQIYGEWFANKRQNYEISQLRDISGLDTLRNGGR